MSLVCLFFFSLATSLGIGLSREVFDWDGSGIANIPVPGAAPIVDAEAVSRDLVLRRNMRCRESVAMVRARSKDLPQPEFVNRQSFPVTTRSRSGAGRASTGLGRLVVHSGQSGSARGTRRGHRKRGRLGLHCVAIAHRRSRAASRCWWRLVLLLSLGNRRSTRSGSNGSSELGGGLAVPSAGGDGSGTRGSPGYST